MQIQPRWNEERMYELQCWNLLDPYQNIIVGVDLVDELMDYGMPTEWVLMAYNGSVEYANYKINRGEVSDYALKILGMIKELG
jgi:soluble lytic murein transglycosylase-like protein